MPDEDIAFDDLIRGTIEFKAGSVPDYVIVRPNGDPLYTLTNPVDDAMMEVNVVLRGEDLLSSTPRQIVLYRYLMELGIAKEMPLFGHMPYVMALARLLYISWVILSSCVKATFTVPSLVVKGKE